MEFGDIGDSVAPECVADLEMQRNYLGNMQSMVYISEQIFDQNKYGEQAVYKQSKFYTE